MTAARAADATSQVVSLSWEEVRASIAETVCFIEDPHLPRGLRIVFGQRADCAPQSLEGTHHVDRTVDSAFGWVIPALATIPPYFSVIPDQLDGVYEISDPASRDAAARDLFLQHDPFIRPLHVAIMRELSITPDLSCPDCPAPSPTEVRQVSWSRLAAYVAAFVEPDVGDDDSVSSYHLCSGSDAASHLPESTPDVVLLRAGFVTLYTTPELFTSVSAYVDSINEARSPGVADRFHAGLASYVLADESLRAAVVTTLREYEQVLGVSVAERVDGD